MFISWKTFGIAVAAGLLLTLNACRHGSSSEFAGQTYYVAGNDPAAADANPGTKSQPFKTITKACETAKAGDTVLIRNGVYREALTPKHSGAEGRPITFKAVPGDEVVIKGSATVKDLKQEGKLWVKRPWRKPFHFDENWKRIADKKYPFRASTRREQIFVDGELLFWAPSRKELKPGYFCWGKEELVIWPPERAPDLDRALVEVPTLINVVCAWQGDPRGIGDIRKLRRIRRELFIGEGAYSKRKFPEIHHIHIKGIRFQHSVGLLNRVGVRLDGDYWILEDCVIEDMNTVGVMPSGDHCLVKNCLIQRCGQSGIGIQGRFARFEDNISMLNNQKMFSVSWGGAGNKLVGSHSVVKNLISCFNYGSPVWYDIDCYDNVVENCVGFGSRPVNGAYFYEVSWDGIFRDNVAFAISEQGGFYGAGMVLSSSSRVLVEDNVFVACGGGLSVGGGRPKHHNSFLNFRDLGDKYVSVDNLFRNNLVVEPSVFTVSVRRNKAHGSEVVEANNQFIDNTFLVEHGSPMAIFGRSKLDDPLQFQKANPVNAKGNHWATSLPVLDEKSRNRLDWALKRVLNGLGKAFPEMKLAFENVKLRKIQPVGAGNQKIFAYWVVADGRNLVMLDSPRDRDREFEILCLGNNSQIVFWDCPVLKGPKRTQTTFANNTLRGSMTGSFALLTGLPTESYSLREIVKSNIVRNGRQVRDVVPREACQIELSLRNPFSHALTMIINGSGLKSPKTVRLGSKSTDKFSVNFQAGSKTQILSYQVKAGDLPAINLKTRLLVKKPVEAHRISSVDLSNPKKMATLRGGSLRVENEAQRVKDIYDEKTGEKWNGPEDLSLIGNLAWTDQALILVFKVKDKPEIEINEKAPWDGDCVELFLDGRTDKLGHANYSRGVYQIIIPAPPATKWENLSWRCGQIKDGVKAMGQRTDEGYMMAIEVPWRLFPGFKPRSGAVIGLDVAIDDSDIKGTRKTQLLWKGTANNYKNASEFGRLRLRNKE